MPQAPASPCPSREQLSAFSLGKLTDAEVETIGRHLANCPSCTATVQNVPADSFVGQLKAARRPTGATMLPPGATPLRLLRGPASAAGPDVPPELQGHAKYRVVRALGEGGMGKVYLVEHLVMKTQVALKVVSQTLLASAEALDRFHREIQTAAQLVHPNIVRALDAEAAGGLHLLVMEYVEGWSLEKVVTEKGPMAVVQACRVAHQAAQGLQHAHGKGMIHRDIKPQNLMVTRQGQVKILDFGLAKMVREQAQGHGATQAGAFMGTPEYVAPEQAVDASTADIRADIYSLGCTLYYLLAGHPPYVEKTAVQVVLAHLEKEAVPLHQVRAEVSEELSAVVAKMMAKDPGQRYQRPIEAAQALVPFCQTKDKPAAVGSGSVPPVVPSAGRRTLVGGDTSQVRNALTLTSAKKKKRKKGREGVKPAPGAWWKRPAVLACAGAGVAVLLLVLVSLWAGGVFRVKTADGTSLVIEVNEPNPEVFVNGEKVTVTWGEGGKKAEIRVKPGTLKVEVQKDGFTMTGEEVTVEEGRQKVFTANLTKAAVPPPPKDGGGPGQPKPIQSEIDQAEAEMEHSRDEARKKLLANFDATLKRLEKGDPTAEVTALLDAVKAERNRFEKQSLLPWSEPMRTYMMAYLHSMRAARDTLGHAYTAEIEEQVRQENEDKAAQFRTKLQSIEADEVVARLRHQVGNDADNSNVISLYANGKIGHPQSDNSWTFEGDVLSLRWPNPDAPGGTWVDTCTVSPDGKTYSGANQWRVAISGTYSEDE